MKATPSQIAQLSPAIQPTCPLVRALRECHVPFGLKHSLVMIQSGSAYSWHRSVPKLTKLAKRIVINFMGDTVVVTCNAGETTFPREVVKAHHDAQAVCSAEIAFKEFAAAFVRHPEWVARMQQSGVVELVTAEVARIDDPELRELRERQALARVLP